MARRSNTQFHSYWGAYATGSLPATTNVEVGDTAYDLTLNKLVVCTAVAPGPTVVWATVGTTTTPASPADSVQFNNAGAFGGSANFTYDSAANSVLLQDTTVVGNTGYAEIYGGQGGFGPYIAVGEDDSIAGNFSVSISADGMTASNVGALRSTDGTGNPADLDLQIRELQINSNPGNAGEVLVSLGPGSAPAWTPSAGLYVAQNVALNATATGGAATTIGSVYFPSAVTLNAASTLAFLGGSLGGDTSVLTIVPSGGGAAQVTFTRTGTIGSQTYTAGGAILAAGWYDLILQGTAGSGVAFARGLYLY